MTKLSHHATILPVNEIEPSLRFYVDLLGFTCTFTWEDPVSYAVLKRDGVSIHLSLQDQPVQVAESTSCYVFCHDVEALSEEFKAKGIAFHEPLNTTDYRMKEFAVKDPEGHKVCFGQELS